MAAGRLETRFKQNITRVRNLVQVYDKHLKGKGSGRRGSAQTDVLRSAVVMLHASMEDFLRTIAYKRLPLAGAETLSHIPLAGHAPAIKFTLGELAKHRGSSINSVIKESVNGYLERSNYNNTTEVASFLSSVGIDTSPLSAELGKLQAVMDRRHQIVHRADQDDKATGQGHHKVTSIGSGTVAQWITDVESFGNAVLKVL